MRSVLFLALVIALPTFSWAEDTICGSPRGGFISNCGLCPAGTTVVSGPNIHNGQQCEGDPTAKKKSVSAEQAAAETRQPQQAPKSVSKNISPKNQALLDMLERDRERDAHNMVIVNRCLDSDLKNCDLGKLRKDPR